MWGASILASRSDFGQFESGAPRRTQVELKETARIRAGRWDPPTYGLFSPNPAVQLPTSVGSNLLPLQVALPVRLLSLVACGIPGCALPQDGDPEGSSKWQRSVGVPTVSAG